MICCNLYLNPYVFNNKLITDFITDGITVVMVCPADVV